MIYLSEADVKKSFSMRDAIEADREALSLYSQGKTKIPLRTNIDLPDQDGQALYMSGIQMGPKCIVWARRSFRNWQKNII